ncbi:hypothetical protein H4219_000674 [Mycoemilia scoparia]|uniref:Mitochondrial genome maintenance protein MGM101 n=1 Tax=Mycoemilia scoparia TaxID=417184 RepID=A0A9W8A6E0_9FUNG|nr:hypothetical protein H4219_000674 [Mycoemilia scoparia]
MISRTVRHFPKVVLSHSFQIRHGSTTKIIQKNAPVNTQDTAVKGLDRTSSIPNKTEFNSKSSPVAEALAGIDGISKSKAEDGSLFSQPTEPIVMSEDDFKPTSEWMTSFSGVGSKAFDQRIIDILMAPIDEKDVEIKPDGLIYLPEIKYRRILNRSFGPGAWGLVPRGPHSVTGRTLSREYALFCLGRFVSQARGEQDFFEESGIATATEGVKSNALMRCCKDLGIASELWDPTFIQYFKGKYCAEEWVTHVTKGNKKRMWRLKTRGWDYPWVKK